MLTVENGRITFGEETLFSQLNLKVDLGEMCCVTGASGRGKSSLLHAVLGFVSLAEGRVVVDGIEQSRETIDAIRQKIAWLPQDLHLPNEWVKEMIALTFTLKANRSASFTTERLLENFDRLGLEEELYERRVNGISGGQRQRIMLAAMALLHKPLLLIDEPTSALDAESAALVLHFLQEEVAKGAAALVVSHDPLFAKGCDQELIL